MVFGATVVFVAIVGIVFIVVLCAIGSLMVIVAFCVFVCHGRARGNWWVAMGW